MILPQNPNEPTDSIGTQLKKNGIKMDKRSKPGNSNQTISNGGNTSVKINNDGNPNSKSSYDGIFGY